MHSGHPNTSDPRPAQPHATNYPFLVNLSALRATAAARASLNTDVVADAFDDELPDPDCDAGQCQNTSSTLDGPDAEFAVQMRTRLAELGDRALETRELASHHANIRELMASAPCNEATRAWLASSACTVRRASRIVDPHPDTATGTASDDDLVRSASACDDAVADASRACDALETMSASIVSRLSEAAKPIEEKLKQNYAWIRAQSTLLGIHGCTQMQCPVCLVRPVTTFMDPCGHTFCDTCAARCDDKCCVCRGAIRAPRKLFWCG